ncbi:type II toxin-antitoxin system RelE/ParE family toxin [Capnocytophaga sp.]|uniref:type II toxin-antitoxin system RelE/ParE family toxin n=1 Tax=Capnocytophaga sp. TaxID=44737 RepID=UPI0026DD40F3|nr:type II toxin-antitoxin system RelE/ParE family toxin [Capnocytophaga sp.]MDO5105831.1 type II toxin-antitoxin system RelE/ParE family toxin [Capnocytophaga sp.]
MDYKISREAQNDMEHIWLYTLKTWSAKQADLYYNLLIDAIEDLAQNPSQGIDYNRVREGYYKAKMKSHFIFYRIKEDENCIEIIRILHQRMDIDTHLRSE